ncbi:hypothetical protein OOT46_20835 [Aquabacterium sp. A7-Y]|uniref:hypothetical protein n=1 Tax=Aquabacterium sp. A7-Y TaxID=1349605 RepID=UPI00223D9E96|nr:hypothetical protein [Aquabacterium sp. A7-Y]MCW7540284.1 hypothetical protein [Aquabacterium sp. A7-Y]
MIEAIPATLAAGPVLDQAAAHSPGTQALSERFQHLMQQAPEAAAPVPASQGPTPVSQFIRAQEEVMRQTYADVRAFTAQAPGMDMHEMASRHIDLSYQLSMVQVQFNAGVYVAQSGKSGLQTLMKNQ